MVSGHNESEMCEGFRDSASLKQPQLLEPNAGQVIAYWFRKQQQNLSQGARSWFLIATSICQRIAGIRAPLVLPPATDIRSIENAHTSLVNKFAASF